MSKISKAEQQIKRLRVLISETGKDLVQLKALTSVAKELEELREKYNFLYQKLNLLERVFSIEADLKAQQIVVTIKRIKYELNSPVEIKRRHDKEQHNVTTKNKSKPRS